ncbi:hypothetical protein HanIR_Chr04g0190601 [Helianthus annuus]|nr:hypothetical protein HanIR_Chr04g0190601 [Helianthus annuus]
MNGMYITVYDYIGNPKTIRIDNLKYITSLCVNNNSRIFIRNLPYTSIIPTSKTIPFDHPSRNSCDKLNDVNP